MSFVFYYFWGVYVHIQAYCCYVFRVHILHRTDPVTTRYGDDFLTMLRKETATFLVERINFAVEERLRRSEFGMWREYMCVFVCVCVLYACFSLSRRGWEGRKLSCKSRLWCVYFTVRCRCLWAYDCVVPHAYSPIVLHQPWSRFTSRFKSRTEILSLADREDEDPPTANPQKPLKVKRVLSGYAKCK